MAGACLGSGYCCMVAPCPYGEAVEGGSRCRFLVEAGRAANGAVWHKCGKHEEIAEAEKHSAFPMMGSGCSSSMFNERRDRLRAAGFAEHPEKSRT